MFRYITLGQTSPAFFNFKMGNCTPVSYELRIKQSIYSQVLEGGGLSKAGRTSKELQSVIQGELCLFLLELEIKVRTHPSFSCPVPIGPNCSHSIGSLL